MGECCGDGFSHITHGLSADLTSYDRSCLFVGLRRNTYYFPNDNTFRYIGIHSYCFTYANVYPYVDIHTYCSTHEDTNHNVDIHINPHTDRNARTCYTTDVSPGGLRL